MINLSRLRQFDWTLFIVMSLLIIFGLVAQYSLSLNVESEGLSSFARQSIFAGVGFALFFAIAFLDFRLIKSITYLIYFLIVGLLILVLAHGASFRGVRGWLSFGFFNLQPTELAKLAVIIVLAYFWQKARLPRVHHLLISLLLVALPAYLIIRQPDLGSAFIVIILWLGIFLLVQKSKKQIFALLILLVLVATISWFFFLEDYQKARILTYIKPQSDPLGRGYQITQSRVAVGSGGFFGRGFGLGPQSQLRFLPAGKTDFIFAAIAEEFGFIGALLLLGLYAIFLVRLFRISRVVYDNFGLILVLGTIIYFFSQILLNVGMNIGLAPVIGIPLPLVSYGGSSMLVSMIMLGLAQSILLHQPFTKTKNLL